MKPSTFITGSQLMIFVIISIILKESESGTTNSTRKVSKVVVDSPSSSSASLSPFAEFFASKASQHSSGSKRMKRRKVRSHSMILRSPRETSWGSWSNYFSVCPNNTWIVGFQMKIDPFHGKQNNAMMADNTALNGVKFFCSNFMNPRAIYNITNKVGKWGKWGKTFLCSRGYAVGFQLRSEKKDESGGGLGFKIDDVGTSNFRLFCGGDAGGEMLEGDGLNQWGRWTKARKCSKGNYLCGLQTQIESNQYFFDDTSLNNIDMACCPGPWQNSQNLVNDESPQNKNLKRESACCEEDGESYKDGKDTWDNLIVPKLKSWWRAVEDLFVTRNKGKNCFHYETNKNIN